MKRVNKSIERRFRHFLQEHYYKLRPSMQEVKNQLKGPLIGAEIGTFQGKNAYNILKNIPHVKRLYLIDPYELYEGYTDFQNPEPTFLSEAQIIAQKLLHPYKNRIIWIQAKFESKLIPEQLDFIYIDGQHTYEAVKHDIKESEKLVKKGGIIGGHDYYPALHHLGDRYGVGRAVRDYYGDRFNWKFNDWWVKTSV